MHVLIEKVFIRNRILITRLRMLAENNQKIFQTPDMVGPKKFRFDTENFNTENRNYSS